MSQIAGERPPLAVEVCVAHMPPLAVKYRLDLKRSKATDSNGVVRGGKRSPLARRHVSLTRSVSCTWDVCATLLILFLLSSNRSVVVEYDGGVHGSHKRPVCSRSMHLCVIGEKLKENQNKFLDKSDED